MDAIQEFLGNVKVGGKQSHLNMALYPLLMSDSSEPGYMILEEALAVGAVEITEISHGGSVPELKLINKSRQCVLVIDGEELIGAKQNRIVNATFLIAGQTEIISPSAAWNRAGGPIGPPSLPLAKRSCLPPCALAIRETWQ